jgi:hypothetical protein
VRLGPVGVAGLDDSPFEPRQKAGRWLDAGARRAIARSDHATALRLVAELTTLGADFERRGTQIARMVGMAFEQIAMERLREVLGTGSPELEGARTLARTLDVLDVARPTEIETLDVERVSARGLVTAMAEGDQGFHNTGWRYLWSLKPFLAAALEECDAQMDRLRSLLAREEGNFLRAIAGAKDLEGDGENLLSRMFFIAWPIALRQRARATADLRVGRTALAVALCAAETGAPPASLEALVPAYLRRVPLDPWDGQPLRYASVGPAKVWSVGRDGRDDGGTPYVEPGTDTGPGDAVMTIGSAR